jgi:hypothetical protein
MKFSTIDIDSCLTDSLIVCPFLERTSRPKNAQMSCSRRKSCNFWLLFVHISDLAEFHKRPKSKLKNDPYFFVFFSLVKVLHVYYITFFLNYRTIDIEIDNFSPNHRIINRTVKLPLSHRLRRIASKKTDLFRPSGIIGCFRYNPTYAQFISTKLVQICSATRDKVINSY